MIRKAIRNDISSITEIYSKILEREAAGKATTGWRDGIYPTENTALEALSKDELFVMEVDGKVVAAARLNQEQDSAYVDGDWALKTTNDKIMVMHTLVVHPEASGRGYATEFVSAYERYAREKGCLSLRMDTNAINKPARGLYKKLGFSEAGIVKCSFMGLNDINLVCLEKVLD